MPREAINVPIPPRPHPTRQTIANALMKVLAIGSATGMELTSDADRAKLVEMALDELGLGDLTHGAWVCRRVRCDKIPGVKERYPRAADLYGFVCEKPGREQFHKVIPSRSETYDVTPAALRVILDTVDERERRDRGRRL